MGRHQDDIEGRCVALGEETPMIVGTIRTEGNGAGVAARLHRLTAWRSATGVGRGYLPLIGQVGGLNLEFLVLSSERKGGDS